MSLGIFAMGSLAFAEFPPLLPGGPIMLFVPMMDGPSLLFI